MRLPGDAGAVGTDRDRADSEQDVDAEPHAKKAQHAAIAQRARQRQRRHPGGGIRIGAIACSWVNRCASAPATAVTAMKMKNLGAPKRRASALPNGNSHSTLKPI